MRSMGCIVLTQQQALLLREAIRPLTPLPFNASVLIEFCERLYAAMLCMSTRHRPVYELVLTRDDVMIINHFVGAEDFDGAADILEQTRAALNEILHGTPTTYLAAAEEMEKIMGEFPPHDM